MTCYAGQTFHLDNSVVADVTKKTISLHNGQYIIHQDQKYGQLLAYPPPFLTVDSETSNLAQIQTLPTPGRQTSEVCKCTNLDPVSEGSFSKTIAIKASKTLLPAGHYDINVGQAPSNNSILIMPQPPILSSGEEDREPSTWPPQICTIEDDTAQYINHSKEILNHQKNVHFRAIDVQQTSLQEALAMSNSVKPRSKSTTPSAMSVDHCKTLLKEIKVNTDIMSSQQLEILDTLHMDNIRAFNDDLSGGYSNKAKPYEASFTFKKENRAPPYKIWVPQFNRRCKDLLQAKCDELEAAGVLVDPKEHGIDIRHVSPCFIQQKARAKHKPLEKCDLSEVRFISCFNVLNESIHPIPGRSSNYNDILRFLSRYKFWIMADLCNSYFQIKVQKKFWKYLAVMTPNRGLKVMTRCGQGLLNSDVELDQVLARLLGDDMTAGHCLAARDDLFVGGDTIDEALSNWKSVLKKIADSNLKVTARKVRVFSNDTEVFGHRIKGGPSIRPQHQISAGNIS